MARSNERSPAKAVGLPMKRVPRMNLRLKKLGRPAAKAAGLEGAREAEIRVVAVTEAVPARAGETAAIMAADDLRVLNPRDLGRAPGVIRGLFQLQPT